MTRKKLAHSRLIRKWDGQAVELTSSPSSLSKLALRELRERLDADPDDSPVRFELAARLLTRGKADEAIALLEEHLPTDRLEEFNGEQWQALRTLAFACGKARRYEAARGLAQRASALRPDALDFHYLLAYATYRLNDYVACERHSRDYLTCLQSPAAAEAALSPRQTQDRAYEVHNYLGLALENARRSAEAAEAFENAIQARRSYDAAWVNLVRLLVRGGRTDDARAVLRQAKSACPQSRIVSRLTVRGSEGPPAAHSPKISACMIVKNEEEHLPRCLESIRDLVDELIIVDTGSTDRTVQIAESCGARVYHHPWEGDFSKARNTSMGYADGEWIFIIDADEEFEAHDAELVRRTVAETEFKAIAISVYNYSAEKRMYTSFLPSIRLFRRDLGAYYEGIVHNQLRFPTAEGVLRISARLNHYGYGLAPEAMARKVARSKALLQKQLAENPDNGFAHFNLAQLLRGEPGAPTPEMTEQVIFHAGRAVDLSSPDDPKQRHVHLMALHQLATAYFNKADYARAAEHARRALAHKPGYLDAILTLGHIHSLDGQLDRARAYYQEYLDRQRAYDEHAETDHVILLHLRSRHNALYGLGLIAEMQDNPAEAAAWFERCVAERDDYLDVHLRLAKMLLRLGDRSKARGEFERELALHPEQSDARLALADWLEESGSIGELAQCLEEGLSADPECDAIRLRLARLATGRGEFDAALAHLDALNKITPHDIAATRQRAETLYAASRWEEAAAVYDLCLQSAPDDLSVLNNLGNCRYRLEDYAGAENFYRRVVDAGGAEALAYRNLGLSLAQQQKLDDAVFCLESYAQMATDDILVHGTLGDLHCARRDYGRAIDEYEQVLEHEPDRPDTLTRLGDCYLNRGALAAALTGYEAALRVDPEYGPAWERLRTLREYLVAQSVGTVPTEHAEDIDRASLISVGH